MSLVLSIKSWKELNYKRMLKRNKNNKTDNKVALLLACQKVRKP